MENSDQNLQKCEKCNTIISEIDEEKVENQIATKETIKSIREIIFEYLKSASVHGFQYLGERERSPIEKVFWIIMMIISLFFCGTLIENAYDKWRANPVIISTSEKPTWVWEIPFPAVTICHTYKYDPSEFKYRYVSTEINISESNNRTLEAIPQVCEFMGYFGVGRKTVEHNHSLIETLIQHASRQKIIADCSFQNLTSMCDTLFFRTVTDDGICYTFNDLDGEEVYREETNHPGFPYYKPKRVSSWSQENGYSNFKFDVYPNRIKSSVRQNLLVDLDLFRYDYDYDCNGPFKGVKILLHTPGEVPRLTGQYISMSLSQDLTIFLKPKMTQTLENLLNYDPERRQCYYNHERYLRYFKLYSQSNCELECLTNYTLHKCGCVSFFMPHNAYTPVCGLGSLECVMAAKEDLSMDEFIEVSTSLTKKGLKGKTRCNCLPLCNSITYDAEVSKDSRDVNQKLGNKTMSEEDLMLLQISMLRIFVKEANFFSSKRSENYGPIDFIANCGGLLGLFMGVSLLSFVELVYFFFVRFCCSFKIFSKNDKQKTNKISPIVSKDQVNISLESVNEISTK